MDNKVDQYLVNQDDLASLCADRPLETYEIFRPNAFYGIDRIIKRYVDLPVNYSLKTVVPHGMIYDDNFVWKAEKHVLLPMVFCYPPFRAQAYQKHTDKRVELSASPFLYVDEMLRHENFPERQGTLFFPSHSTHHVTAQTDLEGLAEHLTALDERFKPITVCIYWRDYSLGHHQPFQQKGLRVVSAGHMYDSDFLFRLYYLFRTHRYASGNGFGSHLFYAVKSGCLYYHLEGYHAALLADEHTLQRDVASIPEMIISNLRQAFGSRQQIDASGQLKVADYYLGAKFLKSPKALRRLLKHAEMLDKAGFKFQKDGTGTKIMIPTFYRRALRKVGHLMGRAKQTIRPNGNTVG